MKREILIAGIGHTIIKMDDGTWLPSATYQEILPRKDPGEKIKRTHIHKPNLTPDMPTAYLGGGQNVVQAMQIASYKYLYDIAFIGGRPASMDTAFGAEVENITEASVMAQYFGGKVSHIIGGTKTTEDDINELVRLAENYSGTTLVAMGFRLVRCRLLLHDYMKKNPDNARIAGRISLVDAEQFLPGKFDEFVEMNQSPAYKLTMSQERFGVIRLL